MTKRDLITKLELLLDIDNVKDFDYDDDLILWGKKEQDNEGDFIWGEIITKNDDGSFGDTLFGFAYDKNDDLNKLSDYILKELTIKFRFFRFLRTNNKTKEKI